MNALVLAARNLRFILDVLSVLGVDRQVVRSSDMALHGSSNELLVDMVAFFHNNGIAVFVCVYLPALFLVLKRANEGDLPAFLERHVALLPRWIRGKPALAV